MSLPQGKDGMFFSIGLMAGPLLFRHRGLHLMFVNIFTVASYMSQLSRTPALLLFFLDSTFLIIFVKTAVLMKDFSELSSSLRTRAWALLDCFATSQAISICLIHPKNTYAASRSITFSDVIPSEFSLNSKVFQVAFYSCCKKIFYQIEKLPCGS